MWKVKNFKGYFLENGDETFFKICINRSALKSRFYVAKFRKKSVPVFKLNDKNQNIFPKNHVFVSFHRYNRCESNFFYSRSIRLAELRLLKLQKQIKFPLTFTTCKIFFSNFHSKLFNKCPKLILKKKLSPPLCSKLKMCLFKRQKKKSKFSKKKNFKFKLVLKPSCTAYVDKYICKT